MQWAATRPKRAWTTAAAAAAAVQAPTHVALLLSPKKPNFFLRFLVTLNF
jgi:hypothetical protein